MVSPFRSLERESDKGAIAILAYHFGGVLTAKSDHGRPLYRTSDTELQQLVVERGEFADITDEVRVEVGRALAEREMASRAQESQHERLKREGVNHGLA